MPFCYIKVNNKHAMDEKQKPAFSSLVNSAGLWCPYLLLAKRQMRIFYCPFRGTSSSSLSAMHIHIYVCMDYGLSTYSLISPYSKALLLVRCWIARTFRSLASSRKNWTTSGEDFLLSLSVSLGSLFRSRAGLIHRCREREREERESHTRTTSLT